MQPRHAIPAATQNAVCAAVPDARRHAADPAPPHELAVWDFAGLMLTYACNARCAFCYVHAGPEQRGALSVPAALRLWRALTDLAAARGRPLRIHLAGGEPFLDWVRLAALVRAGRDAGLSPVDKVETNAAWATDDGVTRARLELLRALGVERLIISADIFHQEFVPFERVERCVRFARAVFGPGRLIVRWWDFFQQPVNPRGLPPAALRAAQAAALRQHPDRLTGRAADELADLLPLAPLESFAGQPCAAALLGSRHVHIDPWGHVFPGTCGGIILGRAAEAADGQGGAPAGIAARPLHEIRRALESSWRDNPVLAALVTGGSYALARAAAALGYVPRAAGYAGKCHLCAHVRNDMVRRGLWADFLGPPECYGCSSRPADGAAAGAVRATAAPAAAGGNASAGL